MVRIVWRNGTGTSACSVLTAGKRRWNFAIISRRLGYDEATFVPGFVRAAG